MKAPAAIRCATSNYMNLDGTGRVKVADNARQPCWSPDSKTIAYLEGEFERYTTRDFATKELIFYDLATGTHTPHPNKDLHHLYNICWSPDGNWFVATVHGGMGHDHAILAFGGPWYQGVRPDRISRHRLSPRPELRRHEGHLGYDRLGICAGPRSI